MYSLLIQVMIQQVLPLESMYKNYTPKNCKRIKKQLNNVQIINEIEKYDFVGKMHQMYAKLLLQDDFLLLNVPCEMKFLTKNQ